VRQAIHQAAAIANVFAAVIRRSTAADASLRHLSSDDVEALVLQAVIANMHAYGAKAAAEWADGFTFPQNALESDRDLFLAGDKDFLRFHAAKRAQYADDRLSTERIDALITDKSQLTDPQDLRRLYKIAKGIRIHPHTDFDPTTERPEMRSKYVNEVSHAVNRLLHTQWLKGTVVLLPVALACYIDGLHWSAQHWTTKAGKACGRSLCDLSNAAEGDCALNGNTKDEKLKISKQLNKEWGRIVHPTLTDLAIMVWKYWYDHEFILGEECTLWKSDLAAAFNLMDFSPEASKLLAFELTEEMFALHTTGMFGWTGTPFVFQVVTRVLQDLISPKMRGVGKFYVDDQMAISTMTHRAHDMAASAAVTRALLGSTAIAEDKSEFGRVMVWIGWLFNLNTMTVSMAPKNMIKALFAFFCCDINATFKLEAVERMASLASRYSQLCPQMGLYTTALHAATTAFGGNRAQTVCYLRPREDRRHHVARVPEPAALRPDQLRQAHQVVHAAPGHGRHRVRRLSRGPGSRR